MPNEFSGNISDEDKLKIIADRQNPVYAGRIEQLIINNAAYYGGKEYIDLRLTRFPAESDIDWGGGQGRLNRKFTRTDGSEIKGRKSQAHVVPHLRRITDKINQYVFAKAPIREGITPELEDDISRDGESIDNLMIEVNKFITTSGWCWLGIDAPNVDNFDEITITKKEQNRLRPYWTVYSPIEIVDWMIHNGEIQWLITEGYKYVGDNPFEAPYKRKFRKLWLKGEVITFTYDKDEEKIETTESYELSLKDKVPFVLVGTPSIKPCGFDSLESVNRTLLDLESCNRQNFYNSVYAQIYLPASVLDTAVQTYNITAEEAQSMLLGYNAPILLAEGDQIPGYIIPDSSAIATLRDELNSLKKELYDSVGLALRLETRQVASAESKEFDLLDVEMVMKERARMLEVAETKAAIISNDWDSSFPIWTPVYNRDFNIDNFNSDIKSLTESTTYQMPIEMQREILKRIVDLMDKKAKLPEEVKKELMQSIDNFVVNNTISQDVV